MNDKAEFGTARSFGLLVSYFAVWMLLAPYAGISHDAQAYAFQAMARLDPTVFGQDVFLRFDSQDRYTIFPTIYGVFISAFGLETSAATLTFALHLLWFAAAFMLARSLFGAPLALLCLALLIAIPGAYGGQRVFHFAESFLTARLPAEAISLLAMWAFFAHRRFVALALLALALVVHPLMAFPAAILIALLWLHQSVPHRAMMTLASLVLLGGALLGSVVLGGSQPTMDPDWIATARTRSPFLFPSSWTLADWNHTLLSLGTLSVAALTLPLGPARALARGALCVGLTGLILATVAGEIWHLKILLQGQPWRWLWLGRLVATVLLPGAVIATWSRGTSGAATAMLLAAAWTAVLPVSARSPVLVMMGSLLATASLATWVAGASLPETTQQLIRRGASAILVLVILAAVATASLVGLFVAADSELPPRTQRLQAILNLTTPAAALAVGAWFCWRARSPRALAILASLVTMAVLVVAAPAAARWWTVRTYGEKNFAAFADWRARIPGDAEVFWWDGLREVWFLLRRRSYLTLSQGGGVVFSGETSRELRRRAESASAFIDPGYWFREPYALQARPRPLTAEVLRQVCRDPVLGFVVADDDLGMGAPRKEWPKPGKFVYLYDCFDFRVDRST